MIEGLKFNFPGAELKQLLLKRSEECAKMAEDWSASVGERKIILPTDGETEKLAKTHAKVCAFDAEAFRVAAEHIDVTETYRLDKGEFVYLGIQRTINDQKEIDEFLKVKNSKVIQA